VSDEPEGDAREARRDARRDRNAPSLGLGATGAAMRAEWRTEQEGVTDDAAEQWRHSRTLLDLARDLMHRGDHVTITVAGHLATGMIVEVASDRIAVLDDSRRAASERTDVHVVDSVPLTFRVTQRARSGGRSGTPAASFRARLLELEAAGEPVVITTTMDAVSFKGSLSVCADLVVIVTATGIETAITLASVASVSPAG
jgi:hypothetical protein